MTFGVFIRPRLTLATIICLHIIVYELELGRVYRLVLDGQLLRLAVDQRPNKRDITCEQLPSRRIANS